MKISLETLPAEAHSSWDSQLDGANFVFSFMKNYEFGVLKRMRESERPNLKFKSTLALANLYNLGCPHMLASFTICKNDLCPN